MKEPDEPITLARVFWLLLNLGATLFTAYIALGGVGLLVMMSNCEKTNSSGTDFFDCGERYQGDK